MTRSNGAFTRLLKAAGILLVLCSIALYAQNRPRPDRDDDPNVQESNRHDVGTSAGGNWTEYRAEDPMTTAKKVRGAAEGEDDKATRDQLRAATRQLDKAASRGVIHKRTAARRKSRRWRSCPVAGSAGPPRCPRASTSPKSSRAARPPPSGSRKTR